MRLEIDSVKFRNFFSYGNTWNEIKFHPGMNIVTGESVETGLSNGSGKSSFLRTIPFGSYGKVGEKIKKADVINWTNEKNCEVHVSFHKGNKPYRIERGISPDYLRVFDGNDEIPAPSNVRTFQEQIEEEILGIDYKIFMNLVYFNINSTTPILKMSAAEKRSFLQNVFGIEIFNSIDEKTHEKIKSVDNEISRIEGNIDGVLSNIDHLNSQIDEFTRKIEEISDSSEEYEKISKEYENLKKNENSYNKKKRHYKKKKEEVDKIRDKLMWISNKIELKLSQLIFRKNEYMKSFRRMVELKESLEEQDKLKKKLKFFESPEKYEKDIEKLSEEILLKNEEIKAHFDDLGKYKEKLASVNTIINQRDSQISTLSENSTCPLCGSDLQDGKLLESLMGKNEISRIEREYLVDKIPSEEEKISEIEESIRRTQEEIKKIEKVKNNLFKMTIEISKFDRTNTEINEIRSFYPKYQKLEKVIEILTKQKGKVSQDHTRLENEEKEILQEIEENEANIAYLDDIRLRYEEIKIIYENEKRERETANSIVKENQKKIKEISDSIKKFQIELKDLEKQKDYLSYIREICKDKNIKQYAISSAVPFLNRRIKHYLSQIGHNFYIELDKWMDHKIIGPGIRRGGYENLSGGESRSVDLAILFAFIDVARFRAGVFPDFLILDEILDGSIDNQSLEKILNIIKVKQIEDNLKVFIISHRSNVELFEENSKIYCVVKENGFSKVEES